MNYNNNGYNNYNNNYNNQMQQPVSNPNVTGNLYDFSQDINTNQYNGYSNQNVTFTKENKKKHFPFFAFLEFLIIIFLCVYIANEKGYIHIKFLDNLIPEKEVKEKETPLEEKKEEEKKDEDGEDETDKNLQAEFKLRAYYVGNIGVSFQNLVSPIFNKDTKSENISDKEKLQSILIGELTIEKGYADLSDVTEYSEVFPSLAQNPENDMKTIKYISAETIATKYKMVYGIDLKHQSIEDTCPIYVYSEKYNRYYINAYCSSESGVYAINQYAYKVSKKDDKYYVFVSVATYKSNEDNSITVYKDAESKEKYKDYQTAEEFQISDANYKEFSLYKYTFTKNDNGYAFTSIEKIS